jgi:CBS-domain-containing membrane protein
MTGDVLCARDDESIEDVAAKMSRAQVRRMPVVDANERLCGIVSLGDLARETDDQSAEQALEGVSAPGSQHSQG